MSSLSDRLRRRGLPAGHAGSGSPGGGRLSLDHLARGQRAVVVGYGDEVEASTVRRFFDLGIVPGVAVTMVRRAPLRDPVVYRIGESEFALRNAQSRAIYVEPAG